jgi:hypothetical protein
VDAVLAYGQQRCLSLRDVGTEMTPGGSKEPSRANTPRATVPAPAGRRDETREGRRRAASNDGGSPRERRAAADQGSAAEGADDDEHKESSGAPTAVSPATVWDAAERAKHMAR